MRAGNGALEWPRTGPLRVWRESRVALPESTRKNKASAPSRTGAARPRPRQRRQQLIEATIRCIANHGLAETTIATVAQEAGLSQGIINLHFKQQGRGCSPRPCATSRTNTATRSPKRWPWPETRRLRACRRWWISCFKRNICSRDKLAVWFAFWGERRFRPTYRRICAARDKSHDDMVREHVHASSASRATTRTSIRRSWPTGLSALTDGLWLDLLVRPETMNRELALRITRSYLADAFPRHFSPTGARSRKG